MLADQKKSARRKPKDRTGPVLRLADTSDMLLAAICEVRDLLQTNVAGLSADACAVWARTLEEVNQAALDAATGDRRNLDRLRAHFGLPPLGQVAEPEDGDGAH